MSQFDKEFLNNKEMYTLTAIDNLYFMTIYSLERGIVKMVFNKWGERIK